MAKYSIEIDALGFCIKDPQGRMINQKTCSGFYLRKAYFLDEDRSRPLGGDLETWCQYQIRSIIDSLYWICNRQGLVRLVERNADRRLPKVVQMRHASLYFNVPRWIVTSSPASSVLGDTVACKALCSAFVGEFRTLFTTKCSPYELDHGYPWLIQDFVGADGDLTVVYAAGKLFPFFRKKIAGEPADFKEVHNGQSEGWEYFAIPSGLRECIRRYMADLNLDFGRIDFVVKDELYYFLEVNPNGQFAWLDPDNATGLLSWIVECITT
jgi:hypothetical protein